MTKAAVATHPFHGHIASWYTVPWFLLRRKSFNDLKSSKPAFAAGRLASPKMKKADFPPRLLSILETLLSVPFNIFLSFNF